MNTIRMSNSLDPDQARQHVGHDKCRAYSGSQWLANVISTDDTSRQRVK